MRTLSMPCLNGFLLLPKDASLDSIGKIKKGDAGMRCDLHTHSLFSDGQDSVRVVALQASRSHLAVRKTWRGELSLFGAPEGDIDKVTGKVTGDQQNFLPPAKQAEGKVSFRPPNLPLLPFLLQHCKGNPNKSQ